jgi:hypothetical protein
VGDLQTECHKLMLDFRRQQKMLPSLLIFEKRDPQTQVYSEIGRVTKGWCLDEVTGETQGAVPQFQLVIGWSEQIDTFIQNCTSILIDTSRYEKSRTDPAVGSPALIRMTCQVISGYARVS